MDLRKIVERRLDGKNRDWFRQALDNIEGDFSEKKFLQYFARVGRYLKNTPLYLSAGELGSPRETNKFSSWSLDEMGRVQMLLTCSGKAQFCELMEKCYRCGDNREQAAIVKSLWLLANNECFLPLALDASRTNITPIFAALCCDNPYPAARFDQRHFNNMVLKAIFMDLPLLRVSGLKERNNPSLAQMINDWIDEREAAKRAIMPEAWAIVFRFAKGKYLARVYRYLARDDIRQHLTQLEKQFELGNDSEVKNALEKSAQNLRNGEIS